MKTIIAGSRSISPDTKSIYVSDPKNYSLVESAIIESGFTITEVVSGTARGVDILGEIWALENNIPVKKFPANWDLHGKSAGYIRNVEMAEYAEAAIIIWDGYSKGTKHMINTAKNCRLISFVKLI